MRLELATNKQLKTIMNYDRECSANLMKKVVTEMLERGMLEKWVVYLSKPFFGNMKKGQVKLWLEDSDVIQLGYIGIWKALEKYEEGKSSFSTFSRYYIYSEWQNHFNKFNSQKRTMDRECFSLDMLVDDDGKTMNDFITISKNVEKAVLMKVHFESQMELLTPLQKSAILGYLQGYENKETAKELNVQRQSVDRAFHRAVEKMGGERISLRENCGMKGA